MSRIKIYVVLTLVIILGIVIQLSDDYMAEGVRNTYKEYVENDEWNRIIAKSVNAGNIVFKVDGKEIVSDEPVYMDDDLNLLIPLNNVRNAFQCATNFYNENTLVLEKNSLNITMSVNSEIALINGEQQMLDASVEDVDGEYYVSAKAIAEGLMYDYNWSIEDATLELTSKLEDTKIIPSYYSYRDVKKLPDPKNQGRLGTCWAFASLTALETSLYPEEKLIFSEDHMSLNSGYNMTQNDGGEYTMAIAYLASWKGPVYEEEDPYGDGVTTEGLTAKKHVQEVQIIDSKDFDGIKRAVYLYGGVQSSLYTSLKNSNSSSVYYNKTEYAYCYVGTEKPNHDVVIVGWDDDYPKENFNTELEGDGAFICMNSWGESFGDNGIFYVSYFDSNIGTHNVCYTKVEDSDNYDNIYQTDLCGWVGALGYSNSEEAYFSNVYTATTSEELAAVSFYATGKNTEYEIYWVNDFENEDSFANRELLTTGKFTYAGYYTVDLSKAKKELEVGKKYAVVVKIKTPNSTHPVAIEYVAGDNTATIDISDGEGYGSLNGNRWTRVETAENCNVCLKMFTNNIVGEDENE